ncbi:protection of telomeres protein 1b isoform X4 [Vigna angularis]|uniref:protection of telomeres protein 1b isoform X4 n=1 Tax=Phaseolus angularis TaxID=3914 RepID=UPI0022B47F52|nr:protection of telomeres protein 1b isoform X4 [Vigna angularis]
MDVPLRDVCKYVNEKVNVIGVVVETTFAKKTMGTDYCCALRIIDDTRHDFSMAANVFGKSTENLPLVAALGDIIQLSFVSVTTYRGEANVTFNKNTSTFALYKSKDDDGLNSYQVSRPYFVPKDEDKIIINKLRKWLINFQFSEDSSKFPFFRELKEETFVNLACKILHHSEAAKDEWVIFVWDGTDTQSNAICSNLENELKNPLPLQRDHLSLPRDILCTFPTVGTILRIIFHIGVEKSHFHLLTIGKWVKINNLRLKLYAGLWHGIFTVQTKLQYISNEDQLIAERQRLADERLSLILGRMPNLSFPEPSPITVNHRDHVRPVTLMSVLTHSKVTAIFKCVVRVVAAMPCKAENLRSSTGKYRMRLTLEDPTARIHALVIEEDVVTLFDGIPDAEKLERKLNKLLGISEDNSIGGVKDTTRNPPWVCVCLKSYYLSKDDIWGTRNFRVFDTKILEDSS